MVKKIYDVIPPNNFEQKLTVVKSAPIKRELPKEKKQKSSFWPKFFIFLFLILIVIGGAFYASSFIPAKIEIWPKGEVVTIAKKMGVDIGYNKQDAVSWAIDSALPAVSVRDEKTLSMEFLATGKAVKEEKAKGVIKVYNGYSESSQTLVSGTRFVSADGKLFKATEAVTIPGKSGNKPGEADVSVIASETGPDYNIGTATFSIPGFVGTPKFTAFYGKSFSPMTGGAKGEMAQITQNDIDKANADFDAKIKKESLENLKNSNPSDKILADNIFIQQITDKKSSGELNKVTDKFTISAKIETKSLTIKKSDVDNFVRSIINANIPEGKSYDPASLTVSNVFMNQPADKDISKALMGLEVKFKVYPKLDANQIKKSLAGKPIEEIQKSLGSQPEISKIKINSGVFWRKKMPGDTSKIDVNINI